MWYITNISANVFIRQTWYDDKFQQVDYQNHHKNFLWPNQIPHSFSFMTLKHCNLGVVKNVLIIRLCENLKSKSER